MINFIRELFSKFKPVTDFISDKISLLWAFFVRLLKKIFGEERVETFGRFLSDRYHNTKYKFNDKFDQEGRFWNVIRNLYAFFFRGILAVIIYLFLIKTNFLWLTGGMPSVDQLQNPKLSEASSILTADGVEIGKYFTENRTPVDSSEISPWVYKALIATEDKRFNEHSGIDLKRMASVAVGIFSGGDRGGGSTISQQLAKNLYNTRRKEMKGLLYYIPVVETLIYKSKEWITAIELEKRFTKGEIATLYLNTVDYGNNAYGIKTAAKTYFNKAPDKLSIGESAVLVGLQKGTTLYNPIRNPKNSVKRRNTVIQRMVLNGDLDKETADKVIAEELKLDINIENPYDGQGNYFKVALSKFIEKWAKDNEMDIDLYRDGLKIYTTIDSRMQTYAESALEQHMRSLQKDFNNQWKDKNPWTYESGEEIPGFIDTVAKRTTYYRKLATKFENNKDSISKYMNVPMKMKVFSWDGDQDVMMSHMDSIRYYKRFLQAGMMAFDPLSGFVKSWVGGIDYNYFKYDHVKQGKRQPGSTFKPVVYTSAIDGPLNLSPCDRREDKPISTEYEEDGEIKIWQPKNANGTFSYSNMTLRSAMARSINSVAVQLTLESTPKKVVEYAQKLGITSKLDEVASIGLGTSDVSLYEMVAAYGVFLNEGKYTEPIFVFKIEDKSGKILFEFNAKTRDAISPESAYLMQYMLRGNIEESGGTGRRMFNYGELFRNGGQVAGKTGTTSNNSDAWYIGFTKDLVCGVWVGGDDRSIHFKSSMGEGSKSALPIFGLFMEQVYKDKKLEYSPGPFAKPTMKIEKDYLGCFSSDGESANVLNDSLMNIMMNDSLQKINGTIRDTTQEGVNKLTNKRRLDTAGLFNTRKKELKIE